MSHPAGGRALPAGSPYSQDDGSPDPQLRAALTAYHCDQGSLSAVVETLSGSRVLVPVMATATQGAVPRTATAGIAALQAPDGRRVLPVFTCVESMAAWSADARPVPLDARRAALSAISEDWSLLVIDPAGPVTVLVPRPAVWALAQGVSWAPAVVDGRVDAQVVGVIVETLTPVRHVARVDVEPGRRAEIAVVLAINEGLDRTGLSAVLAEVNTALAGCQIVARRCDSLELRVARASQTAASTPEAEVSCPSRASMGPAS